jgi:hypothetical protein
MPLIVRPAFDRERCMRKDQLTDAQRLAIRGLLLAGGDPLRERFGAAGVAPLDRDSDGLVSGP